MLTPLSQDNESNKFQHPQQASQVYKLWTWPQHLSKGRRILSMGGTNSSEPWKNGSQFFQ